MVSPSSPQSNDDDDLTNADSAITPATSTITTDSPTKSSFDDYQLLSSIRIPITRRITHHYHHNMKSQIYQLQPVLQLLTTSSINNNNYNNNNNNYDKCHRCSKIEQAKTDVLNNKKISFIHRLFNQLVNNGSQSNISLQQYQHSKI